WQHCVGVGGPSGLAAGGALSIENRLTVSPSSGAPGTTITAKARGFEGGQSITIAWNKVAGSNGTTACSGNTSGSGSFTRSFAIPQVGGGGRPVGAARGGLSRSGQRRRLGDRQRRRDRSGGSHGFAGVRPGQWHDLGHGRRVRRERDGQFQLGQ